jgi:hypothetical protein
MHRSMPGARSNKDTLAWLVNAPLRLWLVQCAWLRI